MKTGFAAMTEMIKKQQEKQNGGGFLPYLTWKDDRSEGGFEYRKTLRFLSDDIVSCEMYDFIPCLDTKLRSFIVPASIDLPGEDWVKKSGVKVKGFGNTGFVDPKPRAMGIAVACLREEYQCPREGILKIRDVEEDYEYEQDGVTKTGRRKKYVLVKQSLTNFWNGIIPFYQRYGSIIDRDFVIERVNNDVNTRYTYVPLDPIEGFRTKEEIDAHYDLDFDLLEFAKNLADPENAKKLLVTGEGLDTPTANNQGTGWTQGNQGVGGFRGNGNAGGFQNNGNTGGFQGQPQNTPQENSQDEAKLKFDELRGKLMGY